MEHQIEINDIIVTVVFEYIKEHRYSGYYYVTKDNAPNYPCKLVTKTLDEMKIELTSIMNRNYGN